MRPVWIIGRGGLLGSALARALRDADEFVTSPLHWHDDALIEAELRKAVQEFSLKASDKPWMIFWAAGQGIMSSTAEELNKETAILKKFLDLLSASQLKTPGTLMFASSAGAIYAGSSDEIVSEESAPAPLSPYGDAKLAQEKLVTDFAARTRNAVLIARISNLYGAGQAHGKRQGLLTHIARCILARQPIHIFVPFDTIRDYIYVDDAAAAIINAASSLTPHSVTTRIIASEEPTTIAEIIGIFKKIARTAPLVITSRPTEQAHYPRRLRFRSGITSHSPKTTLPIGISNVLEHERRAFVRAA